jgi:hypothetical protein
MMNGNTERHKVMTFGFFDGMQWAVRTAMQPCYAGFCLHGNCPLFLQIMKAEVWDPGFSTCCFFQRRV